MSANNISVQVQEGRETLWNAVKDEQGGKSALMHTRERTRGARMELKEMRRATQLCTKLRIKQAQCVARGCA